MNLPPPLDSILRTLARTCLGANDESKDQLVPFNVAESVLLSDKLVDAPSADGGDQGSASGRRRGAEKRLRRDEVILEERRRRGAAATAARPKGKNNDGGPRVVEWLEMQDPDTGRLYYHNKFTGKSSWDKPEGFDEAFEIEAAMNEERREEQTSYWIEVQDSKGRVYYYDLIMKETSWVCPPGFYGRDENQKLNWA
jgi:hypothetical protein